MLYTGFTNWELRLRLTFLQGGNPSEFGEKQNENKLELRVRYHFATAILVLKRATGYFQPAVRIHANIVYTFYLLPVRFQNQLQSIEK